ncbi:hypothetical protein Zm00014a_034347 [Zea mays]|uniref:Uncharacterized protein n=1 Tax=Zea mays TaxID=4577 RepID=A0A3L6EQ32_MAIZE|nr:hypothetical protein Zm00014a_034347 [Zea mays]
MEGAADPPPFSPHRLSLRLCSTSPCPRMEHTRGSRPRCTPPPRMDPARSPGLGTLSRWSSPLSTTPARPPPASPTATGTLAAPPPSDAPTCPPPPCPRNTCPCHRRYASVLPSLAHPGGPRPSPPQPSPVDGRRPSPHPWIRGSPTPPRRIRFSLCSRLLPSVRSPRSRWRPHGTASSLTLPHHMPWELSRRWKVAEDPPHRAVLPSAPTSRSATAF